MSKSDYFENALLDLIFNGTAIPDIAQDDGSSPAVNLTIALHTASPGESGDQTTNEATYSGYARQSVSRSSGGFTVSGNQVTFNSDVTFPASATTAAQTITHFSIGTGVGDKMLYFGTVSPNISVDIGFQPVLSSASSVTED